MPWQNVKVSRNHNTDNLVSITVEWVDLTDFAVTPFTTTDPRVDRSTPAGRTAFKTRIETEREAERTRRQTIAQFESAILTFLNT